MSSEVSSTRKLLSASALMASGTLVSRILGLLRTVIFAYILGNGTRQADIVEIANTIPTVLYLLFIGGALNTVLVPQIVRAIKFDEDQGEAYLNRIISAFLLIIIFVTIICTIGTPVITWIHSSAAWRAPELAVHYNNLLLLTALCMPQIFFYGMFFLFTQVLNARDRFGPMAWAPIANNIISIIVLGLYLALWGRHPNPSIPFTHNQILVLGLGMTLGIVVQAVVLIPFMKQIGFKYRPRFDLRGTGLGHTFRITKWTLGVAVANYAQVVAVQRMATSATAFGHGGGIAIYNRANMVSVLPHALVVVSLAAAILSSSSRMAASGNMSGVAEECIKTCRIAAVPLVFASIGFIVLAKPIAVTLFGFGKNIQDASLISWTLIALAIGVVPYSLHYILMRSFYAMEDTKTPFFIHLVIVTINILLGFLMVNLIHNENWVAPSLALALSISYAVGLFISYFLIKNLLPDFKITGITQLLAKLSIAGILAAIPTYLLYLLIRNCLSGWTSYVLSLFLGLTVLLISYFLIAKILKVPELDGLAKLISSRFINSANKTVMESSSESNWDTSATQLIPVVREIAEQDEQNNLLSNAFNIQSETIAEDVDLLSHKLDQGTPDNTFIVHSGDILAHRYRLEDKILHRSDAENWLAFDQTLGRLVMIQILGAHSPLINDFILAAQMAATVTDPRFARVLDAVKVQDESSSIGAFVVTEYTSGQSLEHLLSYHPLSGLEAAWIIREIAEALTMIHRKMIFHRYLNPETIQISASGNVKILGLGTEAVLLDDKHNSSSLAQREKADVIALGKLFFVMLTQRWPGSADWQLKSVPLLDSGEYMSPRQVKAGISPALNSICERILCSKRNSNSLNGVSQVLAALNELLGTADASTELAKRVRYPIQTTAKTSARHSSEEDTERSLALKTDGAFDPNRPLAISPPPIQINPKKPDKPKYLLKLSVTLVALILLIALCWSGYRSLWNPEIAQTKHPLPAPSTATPNTSATHEIQIVGGKDFDPISSGGDGSENPNKVPLAFDHNPDTAWKSESYSSSDFGHMKPGVGIILNIGHVQKISSLHLQLTGQPNSFEIRVPVQSNIGSPPMAGIDQWKTVATANNASDDVKIELPKNSSTQFVMVYFTSSPKQQTTAKYKYRIILNEVAIFGKEN